MFQIKEKTLGYIIPRSGLFKVSSGTEGRVKRVKLKRIRKEYRTAHLCTFPLKSFKRLQVYVHSLSNIVA
jgi:hypothetical protein